jgi:hypothetical protein
VNFGALAVRGNGDKSNFTGFSQFADARGVLSPNLNGENPIERALREENVPGVFSWLSVCELLTLSWRLTKERFEDYKLGKFHGRGK